MTEKLMHPTKSDSISDKIKNLMQKINEATQRGDHKTVELLVKKMLGVKGGGDKK